MLQRADGTALECDDAVRYGAYWRELNVLVIAVSKIFTESALY